MDYRMSVTRVLRAAAGLGLAFAMACGGADSPTTPTPTSITGTYTLRTVNGSPLPFVVPDGGAAKIEIVDGTLTVNDGGGWTESGHLRSTLNGKATASASSFVGGAGFYTLSGTAITLSGSNGGPFSGSVSSGAVTVAVGIYLYAYAK